jgi:hypothetical protein
VSWIVSEVADHDCSAGANEFAATRTLPEVPVTPEKTNPPSGPVLADFVDCCE